MNSNELEALLAIGRKTFIEAFAHQNNQSDFDKYMSEKFNLEEITEQFNDPESRFFFACMDDEKVGYLKINVGNAQTEDTLQDSLEIERIYVLSQYQGNRIGQLLFDKAISIARAESYKWVWLGVWDKNQGAVRFYERNGFKKYATHPFKLGCLLYTSPSPRDA